MNVDSAMAGSHGRSCAESGGIADFAGVAEINPLFSLDLRLIGQALSSQQPADPSV